MTEDAERIQKESAAYRRDIERSMDRAVTEHNGLRILPVMPKTHKFLKRKALRRSRRGAPRQRLHGSRLLFSVCQHPAGDKVPAGRRRAFSLDPPVAGTPHGSTDGHVRVWRRRSHRPRVHVRLLDELPGTGRRRARFVGVLRLVGLRNVAGNLGERGVYGHGHGLQHVDLAAPLRSGTQQLRLLRNMLVREQG